MKLRTTWGLSLSIAAAAAAASATSCAADQGRSSGTSGSFGGSSAVGTNGSTRASAGPAASSGSGTGGTINFTTTSGVSSASSGGAGGSESTACVACMNAGGTCTAGDCVISDNPGNVDTGTQGMLEGGGSADASFAWLYPYDKTVFPRGLTPPTLQFGGTTATAFYVQVTYPGMTYKGFYAANSVNGFALQPADWGAITDGAGAATPVTVSVTKIANGAVSGPITETWTIAQGSLKGTIYYETYGSAMVGLGSPNLGVGIMKIQPGASAPTIVKSGCGNVCHTASADGSTLVANTGDYETSGYYQSASYDLESNASTIYATQNGSNSSQILTYGGVYPDGSFVVSATGYRTYEGGDAAVYYTGAKGTTGGKAVATTGFNLKSTGTPAFSPDGTLFAYNGAGSAESGGGSTLSVMNFDHATFTFSNPVSIATHAGLTVAWPAFTPDSKWVVYHAGSNAQYETDEGSTGNVYITSSTSNAPLRLDALDGYTGAGTTSYLPANDADLSFAPTVLPEAVGGYFWVVFTSHRSYGNTLASKAQLPQDPLSGEPDPDALGKLWVAALDINPQPGVDPSHPAFYLDGQELQADNLRGFWVLSPCQANGTSCQTGDECCGGYCRGTDGGLACTNVVMGCSNLYESCTTAASCCMSGSLCINGKCAVPPPQ